MIPVLLLFIAVVAFRLVPTGWENFSPMAAVVLCCAAYLPKKWAVALPLGAFLVSDIILNLRYQVPPVNPNTLTLLLAFGMIFALGWALRGRATTTARMPLLFGCTILGSLLFYLLTNTASWIASPVYAKSFAGWMQSVTIGDPAFSPPAWVFFRNSLVGDLFFTALFAGLYVLLPQARHHPAPSSSSPATVAHAASRES